MRRVQATFEDYVKLNKRIPPEMLMSVADHRRPGAARRHHRRPPAHLKLTDKQALLETENAAKRLERLYELMQAEIEILQVEKKIRSRVKKQMEKTQKEYYLNEQMQAIQKELGERDEFKNEIQELEEKLKNKQMSEGGHAKAQEGAQKLKMMSPMSAEATVVRNYIDWILALPWYEKTEDKLDIAEAEQILDEDHYGLKKVKERILEYLAVQALVKKLKGPILCFVGPPGVGKTSLGQERSRARRAASSCASSLGGVRDEAEIRGHRRTYIGALPGKIIQSLKKAGTNNPVFLLDEVDKMSTDFRGDPAAALLEVLDPEQNHSFNDHYLDLDYDLSDVMFITTANTLQRHPGPLQDRMEIIQLSGYTEFEKLNIARRYLVPKQRELNGLDEGRRWRSATTRSGRSSTTTRRRPACDPRARDRQRVPQGRQGRARGARRRSGTRSDRKIAEVPAGTPALPLRHGGGGGRDRPDHGLAWTEIGGELLATEVTVMPGKGKLMITGKLGEVMQESAQAAMSYVRSRAEALGLDSDFYEKVDIHVHFPEGAIPKDGPTAGVTMATTLVSALCRVPVRKDVAMTGEITLRGRVLPIGGLKEKVLAAHRAGIKTVLIPKENRRTCARFRGACATASRSCWSSTWTRCCARRSGSTTPPPSSPSCRRASSPREASHRAPPPRRRRAPEEPCMRPLLLGLLSLVSVLAVRPALAADEPLPVSVKVNELTLLCATGAILCPAAAPMCDDPSIAVPEETAADGLALRGVKPGTTLCSAGSGSGQGARRVFRVTVTR